MRLCAIVCDRLQASSRPGRCQAVALYGPWAGWALRPQTAPRCPRFQRQLARLTPCSTKGRYARLATQGSPLDDRVEHISRTIIRAWRMPGRRRGDPFAGEPTSRPRRAASPCQHKLVKVFEYAVAGDRDRPKGWSVRPDVAGPRLFIFADLSFSTGKEACCRPSVRPHATEPGGCEGGAGGPLVQKAGPPDLTGWLPFDVQSSVGGGGRSHQRVVSPRRRTKTSTMIETIRTIAVAIS
jgi:hypothetical protein